MKKILVLLLIAIFSMSLIACGDNKDPKGNDDNTHENGNSNSNEDGAGLGEEIFE